MQSIRSRQLTSQLAYDGHAFTASKPWHFPNLTLIDGFNVSTQFTQLNGGLQLANNAAAGLGAIVTSNTASITTNANRVNTIIDSGDTLDTISELKAAWEGGDSTLTTAIASLTTIASTDRALIRTEAAAEYVTLRAEADAETAAIATAFVTADAAQTLTFVSAHAAQAALNTDARAVLLTHVNASDAILTTAVATTNAVVLVMVPAVGLNTAKTGFTNSLVALAPSVATNTAKVGFTDDRVTAATAVQANSAKTGFAQNLVDTTPSVVTNSAKVGYLESLVSANSSVAANTAKTGFTDALVGLAPTVAANTAKTGFTQAAVTANTAVQANSAKTGFTESLVDTTPSVVANTAKITFATADSTQVTANKDDITTNVSAIALNTAKVTYDDTQATQNKNDIADNVTDISGLDSVVNTTHANLHTSHTASLATKVAAASGQHTGDTTFDGDTLAISSSTGRVGIGTTAPGHMLHMHDSGGAAEFRISRDLSDNHITLNSHSFTKYGNGTGNTPFRWRVVTADPMTFETSNTEHMRLTPTGRLGLGINAPSHMLHIHDTAGNAEFRISRDLSDNHITINSASFTKIGNGTGNTPYKFRLVTTDPFVWETSNTEWMRLDPNGNLGLGTSSPAYKLDVNGTARLSGGIFMPNLPTSDPLVAGQLWKNAANKIVVSQG